MLRVPLDEQARPHRVVCRVPQKPRDRALGPAAAALLASASAPAGRRRSRLEGEGRRRARLGRKRGVEGRHGGRGRGRAAGAAASAASAALRRLRKVPRGVVQKAPRASCAAAASRRRRGVEGAAPRREANGAHPSAAQLARAEQGGRRRPAPRRPARRRRNRRGRAPAGVRLHSAARLLAAVAPVGERAAPQRDDSLAGRAPRSWQALLPAPAALQRLLLAPPACRLTQAGRV